MMAPVVLIGLRIALPGVLGTITSLFSNFGNDPSVSGRTDDYDIVWRVFLENPYFGRGLFTFVPRYYRILDNQLLMVMLELGAVGLLAFLGLVIVSIFSARGARRRAPDAEHHHLGLAISASIAGVAASYATFDAWGFPMAAGVTFVLIGLAGAAWQVSTQPVPAVDEGQQEPADAVAPGTRS
jgi:O-antigen ligase